VVRKKTDPQIVALRNAENVLTGIAMDAQEFATDIQQLRIENLGTDDPRKLVISLRVVQRFQRETIKSLIGLTRKIEKALPMSDEGMILRPREEDH